MHILDHLSDQLMSHAVGSLGNGTKARGFRWRVERSPKETPRAAGSGKARLWRKEKVVTGSKSRKPRQKRDGVH